MNIDDLIALLEKADGPDRMRVLRKASLAAQRPTRGGCWRWPGATDEKGRGRIWMNGTIQIAHRAVWMALGREIPTGKLLCHHCDNPRCVNPDHLYVGTHADNGRDMSVRKRTWAHRNPDKARELGRRLGKNNTHMRGENNPRAKLSVADVQVIRASKEKTKPLAEKYGVHRTTIQHIRRGSQWSAQ